VRSENNVQKEFARDLKGIRDKDLLKRIKDVIEAVEKVDSLNDLPNLKKLKGEKNYFRVRVGGHRIGLALESDTVVFVRFLSRRDIYKYFP
jgi:mRNA interferase RelE/StbE